MDLQKQKMKGIYFQFTQKMNELFMKKKTLINDFKCRLETRKINKLKDELIKK